MLTVIVDSHRMVECLFRQVIFGVLHCLLCDLRVWDFDLGNGVVCWIPWADVLEEHGLGVWNSGPSELLDGFWGVVGGLVLHRSRDEEDGAE